MARTIHFNGTNRFLGMHPAGPGVEEPWTAYVIEQGDGVRPWLPVLPYKGLPAGPYVKSVNDYIVIPKGKIVSVVAKAPLPESATPYYSTEAWDPSQAITPGVPDADAATEGIQPPLEEPTTTLPIEPSPSTAPHIERFTDAHADEIWDEEYYTGSYPREMAGYIVFANGTGGDVNLQYSELDVRLGTPYWDGTSWKPVTDPTTTLTIPANYPVGIVYQDVYRDIRGRYLNWDNQPPVGLLTDYYIAIPYIDVAALLSYFGEIVDTSGWQITSTSGSLVTTNPFYNLSRLWAFAWSNGVVQSGQCIKPDAHGNYAIVPEDPGCKLTVGKLMWIDFRFPKNMNDVVDTYPGSGAGAGTETGGLPWYLFHFIQDFLLLAGVPAENRKINDIVNYVYEHKLFGLAYINLHVS